MAEETRIDSTVTINGKTYRRVSSISGSGIAEQEVTVPAAKTGSLTTRTSTTVGTITGQSAHGVTTAAKADIYWVNSDGTIGRRYNVTIGTVSGLAIPFSLGSGDDLPPSAPYPVTLMVPVTKDFVVIGDNIDAIGLYCVVPATAVFLDDGAAVLGALRVDDSTDSDGWDATSGADNPLSGVTAVQVNLSHADSTAARTVRVGAQFD